jgi:Domain of unknown function (DUF4124)
MATAGVMLLLGALTVRAEEIYKSVDAQGHVVYSDRPGVAGARKTQIAVQEADPNEATRLAKERMLLKAEDDQRKKQELADSRAQEQQEATKKAQCKNARDSYNFLKDVRRLFKPGSDGEREYYTDTQLDAMREEARRTMEAACGT